MGLAPTAGESSIIKGVDVSIGEEGGGTVVVVGVSTVTQEYELEWAMRVARHGGADRLVRWPAGIPNKQGAALIAIESLR